ncbi:acetoacetyl-CoA synthetase [Candidatus Nitromaritima sp. SCGC AAA799-A02]|nr:acetoacetyl-CoA synthetase [Candidatus Nitromaritima sp. SCGC AAA799-C22]KMP12401.1 acetoacetyl-CoA synthetase [Candidatus Nitromaritima sp. SCGC AAA799-A02]
MSDILWEPGLQQVRQSRMYHFLEAVNSEFSLDLKNYAQLHRWSVECYQDFWEFYSRYSRIKFHKPACEILSSPKMPGGRWFVGAELNYAENLLGGRPDKIAVIGKREDQPLSHLTYGELSNQAIQFAVALKRCGIQPGDRIAGYLPNIPETLIAMLGSASIGAVWSSCSPDFGIQGVKDRFGQIEPKVLIAADGYTYNGKSYPLLDTISAVVADAVSLEHIIVIPLLEDSVRKQSISFRSVYTWEEFLKGGTMDDFKFQSFPFNHPLFIMYSSGTTGLPKCIVHGAGGTLLQHHKEHALHSNISSEDVVFYYTTCGWMMWNWLASALAQKATIVLYEGSPAYPSLNILWELIEEARITVFGTSPKFLTISRDKSLTPKTMADLESLKALLSTGSPLNKESFYWVYKNVKSDLQLSSISGGTDIISCFMLGNPMLPVRAGEVQCLGLGMDVVALDDRNNPVINQKGELACRRPTPSMPLSFWQDPDDRKYQQAYFDKVPGVWLHGDFIEIKDSGGIIVYGRSDATLNPGGVRIGTAEIYRIVEKLDEVLDSLVIGVEEGGDILVILFVVLDEGVILDEAMQKKIKSALRKEATPRHVPHEIYQVGDVPRTLNAKKIELTVKKLFQGEVACNQTALANPECLDRYEEIRANRLASKKE